MQPPPESVTSDDGTDLAIIREIYNGINAYEEFEEQLEKALQSDCQTIVIEPQRLGEETARFIYIGDCIHKTVVVTGLSSVVSSVCWEDKPFIYCTTAFFSLLCSGLYSCSWHNDPCSKYTVETDSDKLNIINMLVNSSPPPVVLVKTSDAIVQKRNVLNTAISLIAFAFSAWKLYKLVKYTAA